MSAATAGVASSVLHDLEDVMQNPFADLSSSSSFSPSSSTPSKRGLHKRRTSEQALPDTTVRIPGRTSHARSRTTWETSGHPLGSDILETTGGSPFADDYSGITRPRLHKLVHMDPEPMDTELPLSIREVAGPDDEDRLVLIHEVAPTDTLAGISLTYGISMANLRRANQLWTSDPIHLRKILHIPLDQASRLVHHEGRAHPSQVDPKDLSPVRFTADDVPLNIHRVPASRLSFFPPTSSTHVNNPNNSDDAWTLLYPARVENTTSLFSAFPRVLNGSKEALISRLSFDSNRTSGTPSSGEHEMASMEDRATRLISTPDHQDTSSSGCGIRSSFQFVNAVSSSSSGHLPAARSVRNNASAGGGRYATEEGHSFTPGVRTSQLEPSPEMQLPILVRKRSLKLARGQNGDLDPAR